MERGGGRRGRLPTYGEEVIGHNGEILGKRGQFRKTKMCKFFLMGICSKGEDCMFAHDSGDLQVLPDLQKTKLCEELLETGRCRKGDRCTYAHSKAELRATAGFLKTKLCKFYQEGHCVLGANCRYAHEAEELRCAEIRVMGADTGGGGSSSSGGGGGSSSSSSGRGRGQQGGGRSNNYGRLVGGRGANNLNARGAGGATRRGSGDLGQHPPGTPAYYNRLEVGVDPEQEEIWGTEDGTMMCMPVVDNGEEELEAPENSEERERGGGEQGSTAGAALQDGFAGLAHGQQQIGGSVSSSWSASSEAEPTSGPGFSTTGPSSTTTGRKSNSNGRGGRAQKMNKDRGQPQAQASSSTHSSETRAIGTKDATTTAHESINGRNAGGKFLLGTTNIMQPPPPVPPPPPKAVRGNYVATTVNGSGLTSSSASGGGAGTTAGRSRPQMTSKQQGGKKKMHLQYVSQHADRQEQQNHDPGQQVYVNHTGSCNTLPARTGGVDGGNKNKIIPVNNKSNTSTDTAWTGCTANTTASIGGPPEQISMMPMPMPPPSSGAMFMEGGNSHQQEACAAAPAAAGSGMGLGYYDYGGVDYGGNDQMNQYVGGSSNAFHHGGGGAGGPEMNNQYPLAVGASSMTMSEHQYQPNQHEQLFADQHWLGAGGSGAIPDATPGGGGGPSSQPLIYSYGGGRAAIDTPGSHSHVQGQRHHPLHQQQQLNQFAGQNQEQFFGGGQQNGYSHLYPMNHEQPEQQQFPSAADQLSDGRPNSCNNSRPASALDSIAKLLSQAQGGDFSQLGTMFGGGGSGSNCCAEMVNGGPARGPDIGIMNGPGLPSTALERGSSGMAAGNRSSGGGPSPNNNKPDVWGTSTTPGLMLQHPAPRISSSGHLPAEVQQQIASNNGGLSADLLVPRPDLVGRLISPGTDEHERSTPEFPDLDKPLLDPFQMPFHFDFPLPPALAPTPVQRSASLLTRETSYGTAIECESSHQDQELRPFQFQNGSGLPEEMKDHCLKDHSSSTGNEAAGPPRSVQQDSEVAHAQKQDTKTKPGEAPSPRQGAGGGPRREHGASSDCIMIRRRPPSRSLQGSKEHQLQLLGGREQQLSSSPDLRRSSGFGSVVDLVGDGVAVEGEDQDLLLLEGEEGINEGDLLLETDGEAGWNGWSVKNTFLEVDRFQTAADEAESWVRKVRSMN